MIFRNFINKLTILISNESNLNGLFPYEYNIFIFLREMTAYQSFFLKTENYFHGCHNISFAIKKKEIDKIEYLCKLYHYIRILKIEIDSMVIDKKKKYKLNVFENKYLFRYTFLYKKIVHLQYLNFMPSKIKKIIKQNIKLFAKQISYENFYIFFKILRKNKIFYFLKLNEFSRNKIYCTLYKKLKRLLSSNALFTI